MRSAVFNNLCNTELVTWAVTRPRFSLCRSVWLHDEFAHGAIVFKSSSNLQSTWARAKQKINWVCHGADVRGFDCYLKSLIWLCINLRMFHGRSLCPSIKGTCSRKWSAAWKRSSNGEPNWKSREKSFRTVRLKLFHYGDLNWLPDVTLKAKGTATLAAPAINSIDVKASHWRDGRSHSN